MGTRGTIRFSTDDSEDLFFIYRGHDGKPSVVIEDIKDCIAKAKGRWSGGELGLLVTLFLSMYYDYDKERLPTYEITSGIHGDESYVYFVRWNSETKAWEYGEINENEKEN